MVKRIFGFGDIIYKETNLLSTTQRNIIYSYSKKELYKIQELYEELCRRSIKVNITELSTNFYATCSMEGAVSSVADTIRLLNDSEENIKTDVKSANMIKNHITLYNSPPDHNLFNDILQIRKVWDILSNGAIDCYDEGYPFRSSKVVIRNPFTGIIYHEGLAPELLEEYLAKLYTWLNATDENIIIKSIVLHFCFEHYHPFCDCNGRTGRYLMQEYLIRNGYENMLAVSLNSILYKDKLNYDNSLKINKTHADISEHIRYMLKAIKASLIQTLYVNEDSELGSLLRQQETRILPNNIKSKVLDNLFENDLIDEELSSDFSLYLKEEVLMAINAYQVRNESNV